MRWSGGFFLMPAGRRTSTMPNMPVSDAMAQCSELDVRHAHALPLTPSPQTLVYPMLETRQASFQIHFSFSVFQPS